MLEPPKSGDAVLELVRKSELADDDVLKSFLLQSGPVPAQADDTATRLVQSGILTPFQARLILQGKHKGFRLGQYRILDLLGTGGMGQVYLAEHVHLHRRVAIKVLPFRLARHRHSLAAFYREARAVAALDHPNVVRAYDVSHQGGTHFLVMEYIEGKRLDELLAESEGRLPVHVACGFALQAAIGLQHAHEKGISHRDIKPANLLVTQEGVVKILDMGLAKFFQKSPGPNDAGMVMGTADYIAPEQATACSRADHRADIYSLGATLYHLVTGEPPFHGTLAAKLIAHQLHDVPTAHEVREDVPEQLSEVIAHMMAKEPADRYQSAVEAATALHHCMENTPFVAETPSGKLVSTGTKSAEEVLIVVHDDHAKKLIAIAVVLAVAIICVVAATILMM